ncbi:hypothetical protein B0H10DRAFT_574324 [Mycena sp. CBHHK59/15]|nr:hypothetical protein B0H10DRAFT_574324 [Mycena sp. CBHHK59/15]
MGELVVRRILNPTEDEIERGSAVLTAAFRLSHDTFGESIVGGNRDLDNALHQAHMRAGAIGGELWVAGFGPEDIAAVVVWFGPGADFLDSEEQREVGWNHVQSKFTPELQKWWSDYFLPRHSVWKAACLDKDTTRNSWQLQLLGTSPDHQHKGLGATLIKPVEAKAMLDGSMMCLETTNEPNVSFYKHLGFVVRGTSASSVWRGRLQ